MEYSKQLSQALAWGFCAQRCSGSGLSTRPSSGAHEHWWLTALKCPEDALQGQSVHQSLLEFGAKENVDIMILGKSLL